MPSVTLCFRIFSNPKLTESILGFTPIISFVVPADNEEIYPGQTLTTVADSGRAVGEPFEIIVVDDASTDRTSEVAAAHQVRLNHVDNRQIAAIHNSDAATDHSFGVL